MTAPHRLVVEDLQVCLAGTRTDVVSEVDFEVAPGEVLGLVGESGSGKTTVALALLGYARRGLHITGGRIFLDGRDILGIDEHELPALRGGKVAYVPQEPAAALNPVRRVGNQIAEVLRVHEGRADKDSDVAGRVREVLAAVDLPTDRAFLRRFPHQLSGGQQQRIVIAMAFACRPGVIVFDEPTTGLDVTTQRHFLELIADLCATSGVAAVYVSHDLAVVGQVAKAVAVMYAGRIVELGPTATVFATPEHPYTRLLMRAVPSLDKAEVMEGIEGLPPRPVSRPAGCSFAARCPDAGPECLLSPPAKADISESHWVRCVRVRRDAQDLSGRQAIQPTSVSQTRPAVLEVEGLRASFGTNEVLHGVGFTLPEDTCVAVVGESGSGKTTLARCIIGMHTNWLGSIRYEGNELSNGARQRGKDVLKRIQYVFQDPYTALNPRKTVGQLVAQPIAHFYGLPRAEADARVVKVLEDVSLSADFLNRYPDQLSGGERQRAAIARALAAEPDLLVCDEVSSAPDVSVQATIVEMLRHLQAEHRLAMLFITHNLALVRGIAQSVIVLSQGRIVEQGPVEEVFERPRDPYTIRLMSDAPRLSVAATGSARVPTAGARRPEEG